MTSVYAPTSDEFSFAAFEIDGCNGKVLCIPLSTIIAVGEAELESIAEALEKIAHENAELYEAYSGYALGFTKSAGYQEADIIPGYPKLGEPIHPDSQKTRAQILSTAEFASISSLDNNTIKVLQMRQVLEGVIEVTPIDNDSDYEAKLACAGKLYETQNAKYLELQLACSNTSRNCSQMQENMRTLERLPDHETRIKRKLQSTQEWLAESFDEPRIIISAETLKTSKNPAEELLSAAVRTEAGTYDAGKIIIENLQLGDAAYKAELIRQLQDFPDTRHMYAMASDRDVELDVRKIPDELAAFADWRQIQGAIAYYDNTKKIVTVTQPPDSGWDDLGWVYHLAVTAHEYRHAGWHSTNRLLAITEQASQPEKLLQKKLIEADAKTFEIWIAYQALTTGETMPLNEFEAGKMEFSQQSGLSQLLHRMDYYQIEHSLPKTEANRSALSDVFITTLGEQAGYENQNDSIWLLAEKEFPQIWEKTIQAVDMGQIGELTKLESLGSKGYIDAKPETKDRLLEALRKTIPAESRMAEQVTCSL